MTKINEVEEQLVDLGEVTVETQGGGAIPVADSPLNQTSFGLGLSDD